MRSAAQCGRITAGYIDGTDAVPKGPISSHLALVNPKTVCPGWHRYEVLKQIVRGLTGCWGREHYPSVCCHGNAELGRFIALSQVFGEVSSAAVCGCQPSFRDQAGCVMPCEER
jgi:hypothetical protein